MPVMRTPVTYSELTGTIPTNEMLSDLLKTLRREPTFFMLAALNMMLSLFENNPEKYNDLQGFLIRNLISDELFHKAHHAVSLDPSTPRPVFHRWQLLMLMKLVLLESPEEAENNPNEDKEGGAKYKLGDACLMVSDLLFPPELAERLKDRGGAGERERILDEFMVQFLPVFEMANPPDEGLAIARSDEYFNLFEKDIAHFRFSNGQSLKERFKYLTGIELRRYLWLLLGTYALYLDLKELSYSDLNDNMARLNLGKDMIFSKMSVTAGEASAFFERVVTSVPEMILALECDMPSKRMSQFDFTTFRSYPLVYNSGIKQNFTCLDCSFLIEKMAAGVYHTILNSLPQGDPDRNRFQIFWGEVFEQYINDRLREAFPRLSQQFYASPFFDKLKSKKKEVQAFDGVLDYGDALVVMEYKGGYLNSDARYSGSTGIFLADLARKIGEGKGIKQLAGSIERIFNTDASSRDTFSELDDTRQQSILQFRSEDVKRVKRVYPVLVVQDLILALGFVNRRLKQQFAERITRLTIGKDVRIQPLSLLTVEDLEVIIPHLEEVPLPAILDEYAREVHEPLSTFHGIFIDYLKENSIEERTNQWSKNRFEEVIMAIKEQFIDLTGDDARV